MGTGSSACFAITKSNGLSLSHDLDEDVFLYSSQSCLVLSRSLSYKIFFLSSSNRLCDELFTYCYQPCFAFSLTYHINIYFILAYILLIHFIFLFSCEARKKKFAYILWLLSNARGIFFYMYFIYYLCSILSI